MSWIIRSVTTEQSMLRPVKGPRRSQKISVGAFAIDARPTCAAKKRSWWPTCRIRPRARAISISESACSRVEVIGFSTSTLTPFSRQMRATS